MNTRQLPDRENTLSLLSDWQKQHDALERVMTSIDALFGLVPEGPLHDTVWRMFDAYTQALAAEVGDMGDWMSYYAGECQMGKNPMEAGYDLAKKIETLDDLWWLIEKSRKNYEN